MLLKQTLDETIIVALSIAGGVTFCGALWYGDLRKNRENRDDQLVKIHHRAGWNGLWAVVVLLVTSIFVFENTAWEIQFSEVDLYILLAGVFTQVISVEWYKWIL
ncbi:hypothetical protein [Halovenus marina]|uniref:hypothetical protein n=1 Tax=Halovenus marina TaxID=3396621 RepID=UPI003F57539D